MEKGQRFQLLLVACASRVGDRLHVQPTQIIGGKLLSIRKEGVVGWGTPLEG